MRLASVRDIKSMVLVLTEAFSKDPHIHWFVGEPTNPATARRRRASLMNYLCHATVSSGDAWVSDDGKGIALWQSHRSKPKGWRFFLANLEYLFVCGIAATVRSLRTEANLKSKLPRGPHYFLWTVGIDAGARGKGLLTSLLSPRLDEAAHTGTPVFLETTVERNVAIYEHYGFSVESTYVFDNSPTVYFMKKTA